jgi:hypothetical protein
MKQTLEAPYDPGVFLLDGANVQFTASNQIFSLCPPTSRKDSFVVSLHFSTDIVSIIYKQNGSFGIDIDKVLVVNSEEFVFSAEDRLKSEQVKNFIKRHDGELRNGDTKLTVDRVSKFNDRCLLFVLFEYRTDKKPTTNHLLPIDWDPTKTSILGIIHLPGLRGNPSRTYKTSGVGKNFSGTFENYVASIIKLWQQLDHDNLSTLCRHLEHIGLTSKVSATALDATQVEIKVGRLPGSNDADLVNIADVGVGVSQTLPVLVALLAADPGQIVYIEQPEIHLHPLAQYKLAAVIAEASKRGVLVVIETHSDILIRGVQTLVAKGELDPAIVKLHWFARNPEDGSTTVTCAELDENGAFGDWPQDFDTTTLLTEKVYLDAVEQRLFRNAK